MAGFFNQDQTCSQCGSKVKAGARFCPQCGTPQPGGDEVKCPRCNESISPAARFCPKCGVDLSTAAQPSIVEHRWEKIQNAFATRVDIEDLPGFFRKELIVEPGTHAILLVDGRNTLGVVGPGKYTLQTLGDRLGAALTLQSAKRLTAILIDAGDVELPFEVPDLWTSDPLRVKLACRVVLRQQGAIEFLVNIMKGRSSYPLSEIRALLYPEVAAIAQDWIGRHTVLDLSKSLSTRDAIEQALDISLTRSLDQYGLKFVLLRVVAVVCPPIEQLRDAREELLVAQYETNVEVDQRVAALAKRQRLFDVANADEVQAIAEEQAKVETYE
ncbi:MAG: zinc-ribbon domain-containing protein, partial [Thermoflexales bacterium]|nr:zinc-ribbon domain-containing protein [Thermoflexales bacterium]